MSHYTTTINKAKAKSAVQHELKQIFEIMNHMLPCLSQDGDIITWHPSLVGKLSSTSVSNVLRQIILDGCQRAEKRAGYAGKICLNSSIECGLTAFKKFTLQDDLQNVREELQNSTEKFLQNVQSKTTYPDRKTIQKHLRNICKDDVICEMILDAFDLAGVDGVITVSKQEHYENAIELMNDYQFNIASYSEFFSDGAEKITLSQPKILVIDGFIETVSEINNILEEAAKAKRSFAIFCRGISEEVLATFLINRKRKTLDGMIVRIPFDQTTANSLKDIAIVSSTDVISSLKGEVISSVTWDSLDEVDSIAFFKSSFAIKNSTADHRAIQAHIEDIKNTKEKTVVDASDFLDHRVHSLTSRQVEIRLKHNDKLRSRLEMLDVCLRSVSSIVKYGYVTTSDLVDDDEFCKIYAKNAKAFKVLPTMTVIAGTWYAEKILQQLLQIDCMILIDE